MECEDCGSHNVRRRDIEGHLVEECGLCGHLQGDDGAVALIEELRRGRERGLDDVITPLVTALERAEVFTIVQAFGGNVAQGEYPSVLFRLPGNDATYVERLLRTIELANRELKHRWLIELSLQHQLVYILRPRFWKSPSEILRSEIEQAQQDVALLARRIRRDIRLSWWAQKP